ncbi:unnamed protein product, partial [Rotaria sp. Silwood1]
MKGRTTRSTIDYSHIKIDNLQYIPLPKSTNNRSMSTSQTSNVLTKDEGKSTEETLDANVAEVDGHVVNDQSTQSQLSHQEVIEGKLRTFQKFNGNGDAEQWL